MKLWSYQLPDFSLVKGKVDPAKSKFAQAYPDAYKALWEHVGTDQIVWCQTSAASSEWHGRHEWVIDVPTSEFLQVVDFMVWIGILGCAPRPPERLHFELMNKAIHRHPDDVAATLGYYNNLVEGLQHRDDPWAWLFRIDASDSRANVLLRHPIESRWVLSKEVVTP
jgi:hypothetical protein